MYLQSTFEAKSSSFWNSRSPCSDPESMSLTATREAARTGSPEPYGAEAALAEAEGRGEIGGGAAEEGVREAVGGLLGVGVGGARRRALPADPPEAEDEEEEDGERCRQAAGQRREEMVGPVGRRRRRGKEAAGGHDGNFIGESGVGVCRLSRRLILPDGGFGRLTRDFGLGAHGKSNPTRFAASDRRSVDDPLVGDPNFTASSKNPDRSNKHSSWGFY
ncbi:hypothetical protein STAS_11246 [Striga asiatica]|uniref:Uncharacterized protein n=1 Tax=Striga asiatica TaxID=4170 RepID=A0A5A7PQF5_STRAF|nr:hypothetical protein STAS_11246 [Striga asiatica]